MGAFSTAPSAATGDTRSSLHPSRRQVLTGTAAIVGTTAAGTLAIGGRVRAADAGLERSPQFEAAYAKLIEGHEPALKSVKLELPEIAENGNMVPFTVSVDSPMTAEAYIETVTILSTGNPQPIIATFTFSPLSGRAVVSGRLRLARTQELIAVAQLNTGERIKGTGRVEVTIGGCGTG